jgi:hypothetical protein
VDHVSSDVASGPPAAVEAAPADEPTAPVRGHRPRRPLLRHWTLRLLLAPLVVAALLWPLLLAGHVDSAEATRLTVVVAIQVFGGALLWRLVRGSHGPFLVEQIGMGLALGSLLALLSQQFLRVTPLADQAWWLPAAATLLLTVVLGALPRTRRRLRMAEDAPLGIDEIGGVGLGLAAAFLFIWVFWRTHPLQWHGWWQYWVDIPYHEALATSVTTWGPGDNILAVGSDVRYHWFAHAWAGTTTNAAGAGPFVVITRVLPLLALLATVCLAWTWARRLSDRRSVPFLAVVLTTLGFNVATTLPIDFMHELTLSPSMAFGAMWLLAAAVAYTEFVHRRIRWGLVVLALLIVGAVGGKSSNAPALLCGIGLAALASLWQPGGRRRPWSAFGVALATVGVVFVALFLGSEGNLKVQAGATAKVLGMLPGSNGLGFVVGTVAAVFVLSAKWTGVLALLPNRETRGRPEVWFGIGAALSGLILMGALGHPGASQLYFPLSAGMIAAVVSAWGLGTAFERMSGASLGPAVAVGVLAGGIGVALARVYTLSGIAPSPIPEPGVPHPQPAVATLPAHYGWIAPLAVWLLPVLLLAGAAARARVRRFRYLRGALVGVLGWALVTASVVTGVIAYADLARAPGPSRAAPDDQLAWTDSQRAPLLWLRAHSATDDVVATNRQCNVAVQPGEECPTAQRWFLAAALTHRRMYVEGADYAISQPHPTWIDRRVAVSRRFVDAPDTALARVLWNAGVRWVVVDLASTHTRKWTGFAQPVYTTPTTVVLRLDRP